MLRLNFVHVCVFVYVDLIYQPISRNHRDLSLCHTHKHTYIVTGNLLTQTHSLRRPFFGVIFCFVFVYLPHTHPYKTMKTNEFCVSSRLRQQQKKKAETISEIPFFCAVAFMPIVPEQCLMLGIFIILLIISTLFLVEMDEKSRKCITIFIYIFFCARAAIGFRCR